MAMVHCRGCGQQVHDSAPTCPHCGALQMVAGPQIVAGSAPIPEGVKGWSWGAFSLNWLWGAANGTWIALLALIPLVGLIMAIVLGVKGREWAWKNKKWDSLEHFNRVQRAWSTWGIVVLAFYALLFGVGLYIEGSERLQKAAEGDEQVAEPATQSAPPTPTDSVGSAATTVQTDPATGSESSGTADTNLLSQTMACSTGAACVDAMLGAASPRRPDVLQAAAARLAILDTAVEGDKDASRDLNTQALAKYSANDIDGAVDLFAQAAQANPRDAEIKSNLGIAYVRAGKPQNAVNALISALELNPRRSNAWGPLAEAFDQVQMPDASYAALLLTYEFSGDKQHTMDFFRARSVEDGVSQSMRTAYSHALKTAESGY